MLLSQLKHGLRSYTILREGKAISNNISFIEIHKYSPRFKHLLVAVSTNPGRCMIEATYLSPLHLVISCTSVRLEIFKYNFLMRSIEPTTAILNTETAQIMSDSFDFMNVYQLG